MNNFFKLLGKIFKTAWRLFKLAYLISMLIFSLILAYFLWIYFPYFKPPTPTQPKGAAPDDCITITWNSVPDNEKVIQELTVFRDGRSKILIVREFDDPDVPDRLLGWKITRNKDDNNLIEFRKEGILLQGETKMLYYDLIQAGLLDLKNEEFKPGYKVFISVSAGSSFNAASGPEFIAKYTPYPPEKLINQTLWDRIHKIIAQKKDLKEFIVKTIYIK